MYNYLYLIQVNNDIGSNIYKIGKTTQIPSERFKGYKKGTYPIRISMVDDCHKREHELIKLFNIKYKLIRGREYFLGTLNKMILDFNNFCDNILNNISQNISHNLSHNISNNIENSYIMTEYICSICNIMFYNKQSLTRHQSKKIKCNLKTEYKCNNCNKCFKQKKNLIDHQDKNICNNKIKLVDKKNIIDNKNIINNETIIEILLNEDEDKIFLLKALGLAITDTEINKILLSKISINAKVDIIKNNIYNFNTTEVK